LIHVSHVAHIGSYVLDPAFSLDPWLVQLREYNVDLSTEVVDDFEHVTIIEEFLDQPIPNKNDTTGEENFHDFRQFIRNYF